MNQKPKKGRPRKVEVQAADGYQSTCGIGMIFVGPGELDPKKIPEILADEKHRSLVGSFIESALYPNELYLRFSGGTEEELCRISAWLEWEPSPPAYLLVEAWENGLTHRTDLLSKWMLLKGTQDDLQELRMLSNELKFPINELDIRLKMKGCNSWRKLDSISDTALVLAFIICGVKTPPLEKGHYQKAIAAEMGDFLIDASFVNVNDPKTKENSARAILKKLGFIKARGKKGINLAI